MPYYIKEENSDDELGPIANDSNKCKFGLEDRKIKSKCELWVKKLNRSNNGDKWVVLHKAT